MIFCFSNLFFQFSGRLNTDISNIGAVKDSASGTVNVQSSDTNTPTNVCSIWLRPGTYIIEGTAIFTLPKQSQIELHIKTSDDTSAIGTAIQTLPAGTQWLKNVGFIKIDGNESKHVIAAVRQNTGSTLSCNGRMRIIQIR